MDASVARQVWMERRQRYSERDWRGKRVRDILTGKFDLAFRDIVPPGEEPAVANLVVAAARTHAQRVGKMPKLNGYSKHNSPSARDRAEQHEDALMERLDRAGFPALLPQAAYWLLCHGFQPFILRADKKMNQAVIDIRDPLSCYPNTVWPHSPRVQDCLFSFQLPLWQLEALYPDAGRYYARKEDVQEVTICEAHLPSGTYIYTVEPEAIQLDFQENPTGRCNVYIPRDFSPDLDFYGQFDQVIPILIAQAKLMALVMSYTEQQVFAETNVIGEIDSNQGDYAKGPNAVNVIRPAPAASVSKVTNNMSPQVFAELDRLERAVRMSGNMPAQLSGEPVASIATGRGIEQLTVAVDDNVGHYQSVLGNSLRAILNDIPEFEAAHFGTAKGLSKDVEIIPKFQAGADPASNVRLLQLQGARILSKTTVRDQTPEVDSPEEEEAMIEAEGLRDALLNNILSQAGNGQADPALVAHLIEQRLKGVPLETAYQEYQAAAQEALGLQGMPNPAEMGGEQPGGLPMEALIGMSALGRPTGGVQGRTPIQ